MMSLKGHLMQSMKASLAQQFAEIKNLLDDTKQKDKSIEQLKGQISEMERLQIFVYQNKEDKAKPSTDQQGFQPYCFKEYDQL